MRCSHDRCVCFTENANYFTVVLFSWKWVQNYFFGVLGNGKNILLYNITLPFNKNSFKADVFLGIGRNSIFWNVTEPLISPGPQTPHSEHLLLRLFCYGRASRAIIFEVTLVRLGPRPEPLWDKSILESYTVGKNLYRIGAKKNTVDQIGSLDRYLITTNGILILTKLYMY